MTPVVINIVSLVVMIAVNLAATRFPLAILNGVTTGEVSDDIPNFFVPAGYVFSIWGVIYIGLILYGIYQALPSQQDNRRLAAIDWLFPLTSLANIAWLFLWHYFVFWATVPVMLTLLVLLILVYTRIGIGRRDVSLTEKAMLHVPFSLYLGWITVATVANIAAMLKYYGWNGAPVEEPIWAVIMLGAAALITILVIIIRVDIAYTLVIIWAAIGIAVRQADTPLVANTAYVVAGLVAAVLVVVYVMKHGRSGSMLPVR